MSVNVSTISFITDYMTDRWQCVTGLVVCSIRFPQGTDVSVQTVSTMPADDTHRNALMIVELLELGCVSDSRALHSEVYRPASIPGQDK